ncbi:glycoside hydrolase family 28 protein [Bacteroidota bacterium]
MKMIRVWYVILIAISTVFLLSCTKQPKVEKMSIPVSNVDWSLADSIDKAVHLPEIPDRDYNIIDFGATGDGETDCTIAIQSTLDKASSEGGGRIVIPVGVWLTGPIHLRDNTHLFLEDEARIIFIPEPEKYPVVYVWYNGIPCMNYSPMVYAKDVKNIAITGKGSIDGQGNLNAWRKMKYRTGADWNLLKEIDNEKLDVKFRKFGTGYNLRPDLIGFYSCSNILIEGINLRNAPYWGIHTVLSSHITIRDLNLRGTGSFMSGITPESSQMVVIDQVNIEGVNEGIQVRAGRNKIKGNEPSENILIKGVSVKDARYNGIGVGLDIQGGVNNVFVRNSSVNRCNRAYIVKSSPRRGGYVGNVFFKNCDAVNTYNQVLYVNVFHEATNLNDLPKIYNLYYENINADSCGRALYFEGSYKQCVENVYLRNCNLNVYKSSYVEDVKNLNLIEIKINNVPVSGNYSIGKILDEQDNKEDEETLYTNDISLDELPDIVRVAAEKSIAGRELTDIDRKIMKTGVVYDVSYRTEDQKEADIIISSEGRLLGYEVDIWYNDIPESIMNSMVSALEFTPVEQQYTSIKIKHIEDFKFYEIEVETLDRIYKIELSANGDILEKRERLIKSSFPPVKENI